MTIQACGKNSEKAVEAAKKRIEQIEGEISTTKESSDVHSLNSGVQVSVSQDTLTLARYTLTIAQTTGGALNPALYPVTSAWGFTTGAYTVPEAAELSSLLKRTDFTKIKVTESSIQLEPGMALDFGASGKGFAGDEAIKVLRSMGATSALLDLGGNIQALGKKPDGSEWNIGIKNPWDGQAAAALKIDNKAVITSGGYERFFTANDGHQYIHIFDGTTGRPVQNGTASVTIITDLGLYGDSLSTALFVMGLEKSTQFWKQHNDFEMIIFTEDKDLYYTEGLAGNLSVLSSFPSVTVIHR